MNKLSGSLFSRNLYIIVLLLMLSLVACGGGDDQEEDISSSSTCPQIVETALQTIKDSCTNGSNEACHPKKSRKT